MNYSVDRLRKILLEELNDYDGEPILLPYDDELLDRLLFNSTYYTKVFPEILSQILYKINYSNVNFDKFCANSFDFSSLVGVKIAPRLLSSANLSGAICKGVEFIGPFDGVSVQNTDFTGSKGTKIDPQTIKGKDLTGTICADVEFIGSFTSVSVSGTNFKGSKGAKINPYELKDKSLKNTICADVIFEVPELYKFNFVGINIEGADFNGSNYEETIKFENEFREKIKLMKNSKVYVE